MKHKDWTFFLTKAERVTPSVATLNNSAFRHFETSGVAVLLPQIELELPLFSVAHLFFFFAFTNPCKCLGN